MACDVDKARGKGEAAGEHDADFVDTKGKHDSHVPTPQRPDAVTFFAVFSSSVSSFNACLSFLLGHIVAGKWYL